MLVLCFQQCPWKFVHVAIEKMNESTVQSEIEAVQVHDYAQICFDKAVAYLDF